MHCNIALVILFVSNAFVFLTSVGAEELTFELPDNDKMCFHEVLLQDVQCVLEFQVITGGNYDVDLELIAPGERSIYKVNKKQYDQHTFTPDVNGEYRFCFSNEFSTFTHKIVYFDFQVGDDDPIDKSFGGQSTALTHMEASVNRKHESLKTIIDYQTHHRLRESQGKAFAEDLNDRVQYWSIGQSVIVMLVGVGQVLILRSFFTDKRHQHTHSHGANMHGHTHGSSFMAT